MVTSRQREDKDLQSPRLGPSTRCAPLRPGGHLAGGAWAGTPRLGLLAPTRHELVAGGLVSALLAPSCHPLFFQGLQECQGGEQEAEEEPATRLPRQRPQDNGLFFVANGDQSAPISGSGRARVPGSRGEEAMLLLLLVIAGFVRGPSRVHHPFARSRPPPLTSDQGQRGSGGQRNKDRFREERGQEKARKRIEEMGFY